MRHPVEFEHPWANATRSFILGLAQVDKFDWSCLIDRGIATVFVNDFLPSYLKCDYFLYDEVK